MDPENIPQIIVDVFYRVLTIGDGLGALRWATGGSMSGQRGRYVRIYHMYILTYAVRRGLIGPKFSGAFGAGIP